MVYRRNKEDMFRYSVSGLEKKMQAGLNLMYARNRILEQVEHRREMEQMKREITEDVLSHISIRLEDEALKQLCDMLNSLGQ